MANQSNSSFGRTMHILSALWSLGVLLVLIAYNQALGPVEYGKVQQMVTHEQAVYYIVDFRMEYNPRVAYSDNRLSVGQTIMCGLRKDRENPSGQHKLYCY